MNQKENPRSIFSGLGLKQTIASYLKEVTALYQSDEIPWVVGYSGGKDSTAALQLVWLALTSLDRGNLHKPVYVISTDTLVENPIIAAWVRKSLENINKEATSQKLPITSHQLTPLTSDTFWVNLIGRGYPAPRPKFRWCTERMKIQPSTRFINEVVQKHGEAILVLGTRKAESSVRSKVMSKYEKRRIRDHLSPNASLPNSLVYSPLENWSNDDVWLFLMQEKNPWGYDNKDLLTMYQGATAGGECPLVVDTSTPSCGDSRFGCWVCTLVDKDKSMQAMIQNDQEKEWMLPLLQLRDELDTRDDRHLRDFRRQNGTVQLFHDRPIHGPYKQEVREQWLRKVLEAQAFIRENGPEEVRNIDLVTLEELEEIRRIWVVEKHEMEDILPNVYESTTGISYPYKRLDDNQVFGINEIELLKEICGNDHVHFQLVRELLAVEKRYSSMLRRSGVFEAIEKALKRGYYEDKEDAVDYARFRRDTLQSAIDIAELQSCNGNTEQITLELSDQTSKEGQVT